MSIKRVNQVNLMYYFKLIQIFRIMNSYYTELIYKAIANFEQIKKFIKNG